MKPFSSSILSLNENTVTPVTVKTLQEKSTLVKLLEFDENIARAELNSTRNYYLTLLQLANNNNESNYSPAYNALFDQYKAVRAASDGILTNYDENSFYDQLSILRELTEKVRNFDRGSVNLCSRFSKPNISNNVIGVIIDAYLNKVVEALKNAQSEILDEVSKENVLEEIVHALGNTISNEESVYSIEDLIDLYKSKFIIERSDIESRFASTNAYSGFDHTYLKNYDILGKMDALISTLRVYVNTVSNPNTIRNLIKNICDLTAGYALINARFVTLENELIIAQINQDIANIKNTIGTNPANFRESMELFGDVLDRNNLFDTLSPEDFNPTSYFDLSFDDIGTVAEHVLNMDCIEAKQYAMAVEAKFLSEHKYEDLTQLRSIVTEAFRDKIKEGWTKFVEALKTIGKKFVESILFNFGTEKVWLEKYRDTIFNANNIIKADTKLTLNANIYMALENNIWNNLQPQTISYNELVSEAGNSLDGEDEDQACNNYFKKQFEPKFSNFSKASSIKELSNLINNNDTSRVDKMKYYLGAKLPDNISFAIPFSRFNVNIKQYYNFLINTEKLARDTRKQIDIIDRVVKNYIAAANNKTIADEKAKKEQDAIDNKNNTAQFNSSLFESDVVYNFLEAAAANSVKSGGVTATPAGNSNTISQNDNTENKNDNKQNLNLTKGDVEKQVKDSKDSGDTISKRMNVYLKVNREVLTAKMTALQYLHKQILDIMRIIVKTKFGDNADIQSKKPEEKNATEQAEKKVEEETTENK